MEFFLRSIPSVVFTQVKGHVLHDDRVLLLGQEVFVGRDLIVVIDQILDILGEGLFQACLLIPSLQQERGVGISESDVLGQCQQRADD